MACFLPTDASLTTPSSSVSICRNTSCCINFSFHLCYDLLQTTSALIFLAPLKGLNGNDIQPPDAWLSELHSWNFSERQSELFHEVELTVAHYKELQNCLVNFKPDRTSPNCSSVDVQSIKLDILRSFKPPAPALLGRNGSGTN